MSVVLKGLNKLPELYNYCYERTQMYSIDQEVTLPLFVIQFAKVFLKTLSKKYYITM